QDLHLVVIIGKTTTTPSEGHALSAVDLNDPALAIKADPADPHPRDREALKGIGKGVGCYFSALLESHESPPAVSCELSAVSSSGHPFTQTTCRSLATTSTRSDDFSMTSPIGL